MLLDRWAPLGRTIICSSGMRHSVRTHNSKACREDSKDAQASSATVSEAVKRLMRHVPHPVAIITATDTRLTSERGSRGWRGATVSSFNTVALDPKPVVSFNIKVLSSTFDAIKASGQFNVHLLSDHPEASEIAARFARGNDPSPFFSETGVLESFVDTAHDRDHDKDKDSESGSQQPPTLLTRSSSGDVLVPFQLHCSYMNDKLVRIGDHTVVFGVVTQILSDIAYQDSPAHPIAKPCLVYVNGRYSRVDHRAHRVPFTQRREISVAEPDRR